jgi:4-amino-4-deoxy-L-arabinose transferase-like glycosyltransferase
VEKIKAFLKSRENQIFLGILIIGLIIRLYFFFKTYNQSLWWDEADYMSIAKHYAFGTPEVAAPWRARGVSVLLSLFYMLGANEIIQKLIIVLCSTGAIVMTYLLGKMFYNKKTALIASALMSILWIHLFWAVRFSAETIALLFFCTAAILFWKGYMENKSKWYMIISGLLVGYGLFLYEAMGAFFVVIFGFLLFTDKLKFLKNKQFWWWALGVAIVLIFVFWHYYSLFGHIYPRFMQVTEGAGATSSSSIIPFLSTILTFFIEMPNYFQWPLIVLFIVGIISLIDVFFGFDMILKNQNESLKKDFFVLWWTLSVMLLFGIYISIGSGTYYEARYIFPAYPIMLIIVARGILYIADYFEKIKKHLGTIAIIILILIPVYTHLTYANDMILSKSITYSQERPAGEWLKTNTKEGDILLSCGQTVPFVYYTEREVIRYDFNNTLVDEQVINYSAPYIIVDLYAPDCNYNYPAERNLTLMQVYYEGESAVIAIYKTNQ